MIDTMKEFLVKKKDTVIVKQNLLVLETADEGTAAEKGSQAPKAPAAEDQPTKAMAPHFKKRWVREEKRFINSTPYSGVI
jgi:pyruvate/2-oxoglutarate dehydrogenase complex dihydrolipoamide acyltransferase (E2) component